MADTTTRKFDLRKALTEGSTPMYAYIGMTDLAIEKVREATMRAGESAEKNRADFAALPGKVISVPARLQESATDLISETPSRAREMVEKVQEQYEELATRGERLIDRIRNQQATQDLVDQAKSTSAMTKGAVTTARKAALDVERSAKATLTTGRNEAAHLAHTISDVISEDIPVIRAEATTAAKKTRTAARRTSTTATTRATKTRTATKRAATGARNTAKATSKATTAATKKVGD